MQSEWRVSLVTHLIVGQSEKSVANYAVSVAQGDKRRHINNHI